MTSATRVLLTGSTGFLGAHVLERLEADDRYDVVTLRGRELTEESASKCAPDVVLHLAAMTDADACERDPDAARAANVEATRRLAKGVRDSCRVFLGASTDLVFDGERAPYRESDDALPTAVYGASKLEGERAARDELGERAVAVRLALMYGPRRGAESRKSFAETMIERARSGESVTLFEDQIRTALYVEDAAAGLLKLAELGPAHPVVHLGGPERASRYEMGLVALDVFGLPRELARVSRMADHSVPKRPKAGLDAIHAVRPRDVSLDGALARSLGLDVRGLRKGLEAFRDRISSP